MDVSAKGIEGGDGDWDAVNDLIEFHDDDL